MSFVKPYIYTNIHMSMVLTVVSGMTSAQIVKSGTARTLYLIRSLLVFPFGVERQYLDDPIKTLLSAHSYTNVSLQLPQERP